MTLSDVEDSDNSEGVFEEKKNSEKSTHANRSLSHVQLRSSMVIDVSDGSKDNDDDVKSVRTTKVALRKAKSTQNLRESEKENLKEDEGSRFKAFLNFFKRKRNSDFVANLSDGNTSDAESNATSLSEKKSRKHKERSKKKNESEDESESGQVSSKPLESSHQKKEKYIIQSDSEEESVDKTVDSKDQENGKLSMMDRFRAWKAERRRLAEEKEEEKKKKTDEILKEVQIDRESKKSKSSRSSKTSSVQEENEDKIEEGERSSGRKQRKVKTVNKKNEDNDDKIDENERSSGRRQEKGKAVDKKNEENDDEIEDGERSSGRRQRKVKTVNKKNEDNDDKIDENERSSGRRQRKGKTVDKKNEENDDEIEEGERSSGRRQRKLKTLNKKKEENDDEIDESERSSSRRQRKGKAVDKKNEENDDEIEEGERSSGRKQRKVKTVNKKSGENEDKSDRQVNDAKKDNSQSNRRRKETNRIVLIDDELFQRDSEESLSEVEEKVKRQPRSHRSIFAVEQDQPNLFEAVNEDDDDSTPRQKKKHRGHAGGKKALKVSASLETERDANKTARRASHKNVNSEAKRSGRRHPPDHSDDEDSTPRQTPRYGFKTAMSEKLMPQKMDIQIDRVSYDSDKSIESLILPGEITNRNFDAEIERHFKKSDNKQSRKALNQYLQEQTEKSSCDKNSSSHDADTETKKTGKKSKNLKSSAKNDVEESKNDVVKKSAFQSVPENRQNDSDDNVKNLTENHSKETTFLGKLRNRFRQSTISSADLVTSYQADSADDSDAEETRKSETISKRGSKKSSRAVKVTVENEDVNSNGAEPNSDEYDEAEELDLSSQTKKSKDNKKTKSTFQKNNFVETRGTSNSRWKKPTSLTKSKKENVGQDVPSENGRDGALYPDKPLLAAIYSPELFYSSKDYIISIFHFNNLLASQNEHNRFHVIDTRPYQSYLNSHINLATHMSEYQDEEGEVLCEMFADSDIVVLYDEDEKSFSLTESDISRFYDAINNLDISVQILQGGFNAVERSASYMLTKKKKRDANGIQHRINYPVILKDGLFSLIIVDQTSRLASFCDIFKVTHLISFDSYIVKSCPIQVKSFHVSANDIKSERIDDAILFFRNAKTECKNCRLLVACSELDWRCFVLLLTFIMFDYHWTLESAIRYMCTHLSVTELNRPAVKIVQRVEQKLFGKITSIDKSLAALSVKDVG